MSLFTDKANMISIYNFTDYKKFTRESFKQFEGGDYGQVSKLAKYMGVHTTFISQVLNGQKPLSTEHAFKMCSYFKLNSSETEYFFTLVELEKATSADFRRHLQTKLAGLKENSQKLVNRVGHQKRLSPSEQATFYSDWIYSACRLCVGLGRNTIKKMANYLGVSETQVEGATNFLLKSGLLEESSGVFSRLKTSTHLSSESPWVKTHHRNWRMKALENVGQSSSDMHYTAPMTLSKDDFYKVKEILIKTITEVDKVLEPSKSETLVCLNIDWFHLSNE